MVGCSNDNKPKQQVIKVEDKKEIRTVSNDYLTVKFVKMKSTTSKKDGSINGFDIWLELSNKNGKPVTEYTFLAPIYAKDNLGNSYTSESTAIYHKDINQNRLPKNIIMIKQNFNSRINPKATSLTIDYKTQANIKYKDSIIPNLSFDIKNKIISNDLTIESIDYHKESKNLSIYLIQKTNGKLKGKPSLESYLKLKNGKKVKITGVGYSDNSKLEKRWQITILTNKANINGATLVIKWEEKDTIWEFPLENIKIGFN